MGGKGHFALKKLVNEIHAPGYSASIKVSSSHMPSCATGLPSLFFLALSILAVLSEQWQGIGMKP